jgi:predicted P-loop ATPase/GTPase
MRSFELALMSEKELLHLSGMGFFIHDIIDETPIQETKMPPDLNKILSEFSHLFEEPVGLPPTRSHDH